MLYRKPEQDLDELRAVLNQAHDKLIANKEKAVKQQAWAYAAGIRMIEKHLEEFIYSLNDLQDEFTQTP